MSTNQITLDLEPERNGQRPLDAEAPTDLLLVAFGRLCSDLGRASKREGVTRAELLDGILDLQDALRDVLQPEQGFDAIDSQQLATGNYELEYLIDDILVKGQPAILAGPKKTLKTNCLIDLTLSLSDGLRFLGRFQVARPVRVGLMSGESGAATIQETAIRIAASKGRPLSSNFSNVRWCFEIPNLDDAKQIESLRSLISTHELEVLILDPAYLMMMGIADSAGNLFAVGKLLRNIADIGQESGCTIILCHHTRKNVADPYQPPELDHIAWAGFQEFARQWLLIARRSKYDPEQAGHHELWLASGGSAGHSELWAVNIEEGSRKDPGGRRWEVELFYPSQARRDAAEAEQEAREQQKTVREEAQAKSDRKRILEVMERFPDGETKTTIKEASGIRPQRFSPLFGEMEAEGLLQPCQIKKENNRDYDGWKLAKQ